MNTHKSSELIRLLENETDQILISHKLFECFIHIRY
jgi:hypothetical protein